MEKPWNFVILFSAREGSSAIIDMLGKQNDVNIPLFEHLDLHSYPKHHRKDELPAIVEETFRSGIYPRNLETESVKYVQKPGDRFLVTGYKWRIWGNRRKLADIFYPASRKAVCFVPARFL